ncbi:ABC transporter permease [Nannocystis pusilla]|uniref:ABC transporter permease n=1 Tax=Nannocystis pusilla TaxID=889268 RepID=UPI003BEFD0A6
MSFKPGRPGHAHLAIGLLAGAAVVFFALPLLGLLVRVAPAELWRQLAAPSVQAALRLSLYVSLCATGLSLLLGLPLAYALARLPFPGRGLARALVTLPMVLPPVVGGTALLAAFGRRGLLGGLLEHGLGVILPYTTGAAVLAATFVAAPFLVITVEGALRGLDPRLEQAAATLGASRLRIVGTVVLPAIRPSLVAGLALCWARALGEFGATITFAGNLQGRTQTMPLAVYEALHDSPDGAVALSLILLAVSLVLLAALRGHFFKGAG